MAIDLTAGYSLSSNDSAPGVKNYWILNEEPETITPSTGGPITAFTTVGDDGVWYKYECAYGEGDWTSTASSQGGGLEYVLNANYRIGGLSQAKIQSAHSLLKSSRLTLVAEHTDGKYYLLTRNGAAVSTGAGASGTAGGGAGAVGNALTFVAADSEPVAEITVATTLAAITDA